MTNEVNYYQITEHYGNDYTFKFLVSFSESDKFNFFLSNSSYEDDSITTKFTANKIINDVEYSEVYTVYKDTLNSNPRISLFIKAANHGIVQFHDMVLSILGKSCINNLKCSVKGDF